jgi:hypothetical protein
MDLKGFMQLYRKQFTNGRKRSEMWKNGIGEKAEPRRQGELYTKRVDNLLCLPDTLTIENQGDLSE